MVKPHHAQLSDAELVAQALAGDKAAFASLIDRHRGRLKRLLPALLSDPAQIDDVWQESLLRAYLNLEQLRDPARFGAWLYSIALNLARSQHALHWPGLLSLEAGEGDEAGPPEPASPEELAIRRDLSQRVRQAVAELPPAEREAIMLVYLQERSHKEAALELGASLGTIKVRVHRGRRRLKAAFQNERQLLPTVPHKENNMIEAMVHDVIIPRANPAEEEKANPVLRLQDMLSPYRTVIIKERQGERAIAIWIGPFEADVILMRLRDMSQFSEFKVIRPLTHDLTKTLLEVGQISVERAIISRLHEDTFYASLLVKTAAGLSEVDCRPSDALGLALRVDAPIYIAPEVMEDCGFTPDASGAYTWEQYQAGSKILNSKSNETEVKPFLWFSMLQIGDEQIKQLLAERKKLFNM